MLSSELCCFVLSLRDGVLCCLLSYVLPRRDDTETRPMGSHWSWWNSEMIIFAADMFSSLSFDPHSTLLTVQVETVLPFEFWPKQDDKETRPMASHWPCWNSSSDDDNF